MKGDKLIGDAQVPLYDAETLLVHGGKKGLVRSGLDRSVRDEDVAAAMAACLAAEMMLFRALRARGASEIWIENAVENAIDKSSFVGKRSGKSSVDRRLFELQRVTGWSIAKCVRAALEVWATSNFPVVKAKRTKR